VLEGERLVTGRAVVVEGARVSRVEADEAIPSLPGDWTVDARGRLLTPGRVDAHARLTGAAAGRAWSTAEVESLAAGALGRALRKHLAALRLLSPQALVEDRYRKFRSLGVFAG